MNPEDLTRVEALEASLRYAFPDRDLALRALTHKSWVNEHPDEGVRDNERLEFLGDAVVGLVVSKHLMAALPDAPEGRLSQLRAALVNAEALARVARTLELGARLRLGRGEDQTGGRDKSSLLANVLEAVIGAVYLVDGLEAATGMVERHLLTDAAVAEVRRSLRDYKTRLQEYAQGTLGMTPRYQVVNAEGPDHRRVFDIEVRLDDTIRGRGRGHSKKEAQQHAARAALAELGVQAEEED